MLKDDELPLIKITLIGEPDVGKTSILNNFIDKSSCENHESTVGANYVEKVIKKNGKEYDLIIWDTAGQEKFNTLGKHFYKDSYININ